MGKRFGLIVLVASLAAPAAAQFSNSYNFIKAVKERDGTKVTELASGASSAIVINSKEPGTGDGGLHIVAKGRDFTWLSFLLSNGARIDQQNNDGETALSVAAKLGWTEGAQLLLARRAGVDVANNRGETPLILAVHRRDPAMVRMLLARGANPKRTDNVAGYSAIDYAKQDRRTAAILKLLETPVVPVREAAGPKL